MVSFGAKTLIVWDMAAGAQKATFTADKVRVCRFRLKVLPCEKLFRKPGLLESGIQNASRRNLARVRIQTTFNVN